MSDPVRIGVVGAGLIGQAVHIPALARMSSKFRLTGIADPSQKVREALASRYPGVGLYADWRELLEKQPLDAVAVCSPHATHAQITLAALDAGLHVFTEKPLAITVEDVDAISKARSARRRVVQVGYMKRFDAGFESLLAELPASAGQLRLIDVVTHDPWMARPPFAPADFVSGDDIPTSVRRAVSSVERAQVEAAVGAGDPASVQAFSHIYLACLIHDVNLVHGVLEHLGVPTPAQAVTSAHWASGKAANAVFELAGGIRWQCAWLLLDGLGEFSESAAFYFEDRIHRLHFDAPYLRERPSVLEIRTGGVGAPQGLTRHARVKDAYAAELEHFHACITDGAACQTPPEQARTDLTALRDAFLARPAAAGA